MKDPEAQQSYENANEERYLGGYSSLITKEI